MIFIHPMWDNENQRLGLKRCTPLGYAIICIGDLVGFLGLLTLIAYPVYLIYRLTFGQFSPQLLLLFFIPITIGILGRVLYEFGWRLALRKQFNYDYGSRSAHWNDAGTLQSFPASEKWG